MASKYTLIAASIALSTTLSSCGGGSGDTKASIAEEIITPVEEVLTPGLLVAIETQDQLLQSFRQGFDQTIKPVAEVAVEITDAMPTDAAVADASDGGASKSYTTTYTLEKNIDEHDAVKYNGSHLFIAPSRSMDCCFIVDDIVFDDRLFDDALMVAEDGVPEESVIEQQKLEHSIRILATDPEQAGAIQVSSIAVDSNRSIEGLYITDTQLISIDSSGWWGLYGDAFTRSRTWQGQNTGLSIYNISDTANPTLDWQVELEGGFISSRKKGDTVYLVARHTPRAEGLHYYPTDDEMVSGNQAILDALSIEDILPKISINGFESPLLGATDCSVADTDHSTAPTKTYMPTMTLLVAIDLAENGEPSVAQAICYMEPTSGIYVSENAIYLTQADYSNSKARTFVHKYALNDEITYSGSGVVDGNISGSSTDFRINEYADHLRLVTTQYIDDSSDRIDHQVFVLKQSETKAELEVIATLPNEQRSNEIGKPNEDLYGVRFLGDTLYLVTFERTDPLYVIDLTNPADPLIAGELSVPGFSDFLHPVNNQLLLGLGQDENNGVKLELFNVAEIDSPYSLGTVSLAPDASWSRSEARYNHHAFTYQAISESTDRFSIPLSLGVNDDANGYQEEDRLYLFEIDSKDTPELSSITEVGHIRAKSQWWNSLQRAVFDGDAVYFINGSDVWSALWSEIRNNSTEQNGPL